ncbi:uncharacterized protein LOC107803276 [Nicotiana tabacum]|uniref:uncharacterized protein LOC107803276 n=1 Tax=Nicotiana tabacum TaxID=4097 RepID=UPI003F4E9C59
MEPKQQSRTLERYRSRLGLALAFVNISNKIWAFIDDDFEVMMLFDMQQQLTLRLTDTNTQQEFILTLVYAKCDHIERIELWDTLYALASDMTTPWIVGGDFNVIWDEEEKFGGLPVPINEVDDFRDCINSCNLNDLGFKGSIFTCWNGRAEEDCSFKRLDRVLGNIGLQQLLPSVEVTHLSKIGSDHCPLLIKCDPNLITAKKQFRFLNFWTDHNTFQEVVKENWVDDLAANSQVTSFTIFNNKLKKLKKVLSRWSKDIYGDIFQKVASLEEVVLVHEAQFELSPTSMNRERLNKVKAKLTRYLALEEQFWRQKTGMAWFKDGDRNTKFFHAHVNRRRKILQLKRIQDSAGNWIEGNDQMAEEAISFFKSQFHEGVLEKNQELLKQPTKEEVKQAVFGLNADNAGGPDGFTGFIKGRSIVENILLTNEIITDIRLRTKAVPNVVLKLDMTKAYDRLSWLFMTKVLRKMGFEERIIGIVFRIVSNNWYSILMNEQPYGFFKSTRGVKQGDPLSPTLFILSAEALSRALNSLHQNLYFCDFGLSKWSPKINHLSYADDRIIFSSFDAMSLKLIMEVLRAYETTSGQLINKAKSAVYLHHLTNVDIIDKVQSITSINRRKMEYYHDLMKKVLDKIQSWQGKILSIGGRAVLINHVLQGMPIHLLSAVNPPASVINKLYKMIAQFFWSNSIGGKARHWASWDSLCLPKEEGGVGFRSLHDMPRALFCKLWWNFRTKPTLWSSFMCQKYCKKLNAIVVPWRKGSHVWRKMLDCREAIEHQIIWQPRMGSSLFWFDNWTEMGGLYFTTPPKFYYDESIHNVHDVMLEGTWNETRLMQILPHDIASHIIANIKPTALSDELDKPFWMMESKGYFTVKSTWDYVRRMRDQNAVFTNIWVKGLPFKIVFFMWKVWKGRIPLDDFFKSTYSVLLLHGKCWNFHNGMSLQQAIAKCWTVQVVPRLKPIFQALPSIILWELWKRRNCQKHGEMVNTDGASRGNPGRSSIGFVLRDSKGDVRYARGKEIKEGTNMEAETIAILEAIQTCVQQGYANIHIQTDSLFLKNVIDGTWDPPWAIEAYVQEIKQFMARCNCRVSHIMREGNKLADFLANHALDHEDHEAHNFQQLEIQEKRIVNRNYTIAIHYLLSILQMVVLVHCTQSIEGNMWVGSSIAIRRTRTKADTHIFCNKDHMLQQRFSSTMKVIRFNTTVMHHLLIQCLPHSLLGLLETRSAKVQQHTNYRAQQEWLNALDTQSACWRRNEFEEKLGIQHGPTQFFNCLMHACCIGNVRK